MGRKRFNAFERPPWWATIVILIGAIFLAVAFGVTAHRGQVSAAEADQMRAQNRAVASRVDAQIAAEQPLPVLVIGDSYTAGSAMGGVGDNGWPALIHSALVKAGYRVTVRVSASGGSGYTEPGPNNQTLGQLAKEAAGGYRLVVFFGSRNDTAPEAEVQAAAAQAFTAAKATSPGVRLLVIGPPWVNGSPPVGIIADRNAVRAAAGAAGATFVDPLTEGWFAGRYASLIGLDGVHPTDAGHRHLADLMLPRLEQQLQALGSKPSRAG